MCWARTVSSAKNCFFDAPLASTTNANSLLTSTRMLSSAGSAVIVAATFAGLFGAMVHSHNFKSGTPTLIG